CDIGIKDGVVATLGRGLPAGAREIDAAGKLVLPGAIDSHCHIEQKSSAGVMCADDFYSGTVSAAFGGTTTIIPFAAQHRGTSVTTTVADYHERARSKAVIDYGFHLIIGDPTERVLTDELPAAIKGGITSFKVYMTYPKWKLEDYQLLEIMSVAENEGALVMVHAENDDMIRCLAKRLIERGHGAPKFHGVAHSPLAATRQGGAGGNLGRPRQRHVPGLFVGSRALSVRQDGEDSSRRANHFQGDGERRSGHRDAPADPLLGGRTEEAPHAQPVRRA